MAAVPDADVAGALFEEYERGLYRFCLGRLRSPEEAEDAVQTTFVRAVRALERGVRPEVAPAWLFTIARNVCSSRRLAALRRARVETPRDLDHLRASALAFEDERPDELIGLREALAAMPPKLQRVVLLREWQGLSYGEIGAELGVSQPAVETLLYRARRDLAKRLRGLLDLGPLFGLKALLGGATVAAVAVATVHVPRPEPVAAHAVEAAPAAVPHATALPVTRQVVRAARPVPVKHGKQVAPRPVVQATPAPAPVVPPPPVPVREHETRPAEIDAVPRPQPSVVPAPPAPAPPPSASVAPATAPAEPAPAPAAGDGTPPAAPVVSVPAPVAATAQEPLDEVQQTAATAVATSSSVVPPLPQAPAVPSPSTVLGGD